jgi:hypothetical protein
MKTVDLESVKDVDRETIEAAGFRPVLRWERDGVEVCTRTALEAAGVTARVDLPALRQAHATIRAHEALLAAACLDVYSLDGGGPPSGTMRAHALMVMRDIIGAITHVCDDEFRGSENRGNS